jgi:SAM-dependent methyltransferase
LLASARRLLGNVGLYIALQKGLGADRVRYRCLEDAELKPGERVLDLGCGPAYYFDRLPDVRYVGFDTSPEYIAYARRRYGDRGDFRCELFTAEHVATLGQFDAVLLFGLLHHLDDGQCASLLDLAAKALAPGGRVISCDPCLHTGQNRISRWMSKNDRGEHVRPREGFNALAETSFADVTSRLLDTESRVPTSHHLMRMSSPRQR